MLTAAFNPDRKWKLVKPKGMDMLALAVTILVIVTNLCMLGLVALLQYLQTSRKDFSAQTQPGYTAPL